VWKQAVPRFVARAIRNLSFSVSKFRYCGTRIRTHITTFLQHNRTPAQRPERSWNLTARDSTKGWCFCLIFWTNLKMKFVRWASYCIYFVFCILYFVLIFALRWLWNAVILYMCIIQRVSSETFYFCSWLQWSELTHSLKTHPNHVPFPHASLHLHQCYANVMDSLHCVTRW